MLTKLKPNINLDTLNIITSEQFYFPGFNKKFHYCHELPWFVWWRIIGFVLSRCHPLWFLQMVHIPITSLKNVSTYQVHEFWEPNCSRFEVTDNHASFQYKITHGLYSFFGITVYSVYLALPRVYHDGNRNLKRSSCERCTYNINARTKILYLVKREQYNIVCPVTKRYCRRCNWRR